MKIGIVCYPTYGGSGVIATELGKALADRGHQIHFITYSQPARLDHFTENIFYHEVYITDYPLFEYPPYLLALAGKLIDVVKYEKLDLLHVHYAIPHASAAYLAMEVLKEQGLDIPVVTTLHGTDISLVGKEPLFEPLVSFAINKSDGVTAVSNALKEETLANFTIKKEIEVIHNFLDFDRFKHQKKAHFKQLIAPNNEKVFIHISNFRPLKRVDNVIKVFDIIRNKVPSKLLLVGDGPERRMAEQLCRELGSCDEVKFLGKQDAVEEILAISDVFIMPSETESFGLAALESMACGVPVISSNVGGLSEVNIHGVTGFLSDYNDIELMAENAMKIIENEETLERFRKNALEQASKFDIKNIAPIYLAFYQKVINEKASKVK